MGEKKGEEEVLRGINGSDWTKKKREKQRSTEIEAMDGLIKQ